MRVKVEGLESTFLEGVFAGEDNRYFSLVQANGKLVKIPLTRIVLIEEQEASFDMRAKPTPPQFEPAFTSPVDQQEPTLASVIANEPITPELVAKNVKTRKRKKVTDALEAYFDQMNNPGSIMRSDAKSLSGLSQIDPPPPMPVYDPDDLVLVDVVFEGAKTGGFKLDIPTGVMTGAYSPSLGREIFSYQEVKNFLNGIVLDGVPQVEANKVTYTTKNMTGSTASAEMDIKSKLELAGKAIAVGTTFATTDRPKPRPTPASFSMTDSPFNALANLSLTEEPDEDS